VEFNSIIHAIPLIDYEIEDNTQCVVSGWGATEWRGSMPLELQKANVTIVSRTACNFSYADIITKGMVCANGLTDNGVVDVCQGGKLIN
jgi:hypothetical protein